jgi:hypothetical protein
MGACKTAATSVSVDFPYEGVPEELETSGC